MRLFTSSSLSKRSSVRAVLAVSALAVLALSGCSSSTSVEGVWGDPDSQGQPSLEFGADGEVTGTDGCNRLMGSYTENDGEVKLAELASTMMFCEDVDTWLNNAAAATLSGKTLTLFDDSGTEIGTLDRSAD